MYSCFVKFIRIPYPTRSSKVRSKCLFQLIFCSNCRQYCRQHIYTDLFNHFTTRYRILEFLNVSIALDGVTSGLQEATICLYGAHIRQFTWFDNRNERIVPVGAFGVVGSYFISMSSSKQLRYVSTVSFA